MEYAAMRGLRGSGPLPNLDMVSSEKASHAQRLAVEIGPIVHDLELLLDMKDVRSLR